MALLNRARRLSEAEYLEMERAAAFKSEFFDGEVFAMSGGTRWHSLIAANLIGELRQRLKGRECFVFDSNLRMKVEATGLYTYPDVTVACEEQRFVDEEMDTLLNPTLVAEVLSDSTEAYDRGKKFEHYRQIPSLRGCLFISQREPRIEQFVRQKTGEWLLSEASGIDSKLFLPPLKVTIALAEVFACIQFLPVPIRRVVPARC
jgi:Uma2 family endonuclease